MAKSGSDSEIVIIKKYANRRLYNTETSSYITLDHLARMTRADRDFKVIDARTGDDITHNVLTQIIMDEEGRGQNMLPVNFLKQLIALYGNSMSAMVPQYLEASMDAFQRNQAQFRDAMQGAFAAGPFAELAKRNMAMFEAATDALRPGGAAPTPAAAPDPADRDAEMAELRAQLATLQDKIDKLSR